MQNILRIGSIILVLLSVWIDLRSKTHLRSNTESKDTDRTSRNTFFQRFVYRSPSVRCTLCCHLITADCKAAPIAKEEFDQLNKRQLNVLRTLLDEVISPSVLALPRKKERCTPDKDEFIWEILGALLEKHIGNVDTTSRYCSKILINGERGFSVLHR